MPHNFKKIIFKKFLTFLPSLILIIISILFSFKLWYSVLATDLPETPPVTAPVTPPETPPVTPPGGLINPPYPTVSGGIYYSSITTWLALDPGAFQNFYSYYSLDNPYEVTTGTFTGDPIFINYLPGAVIKFTAYSYDGLGISSLSSDTYYVFEDTPVATDINNLSSLIDSLAFSYIEIGEDVPAAQINVDMTLTIPNSLGTTNTVFLPEYTRIMRDDNILFEPSALTASDISLSEISGLGANTIAKGALQWGILNHGLVFSSPITISIYVGSNLNNQTLNVARSIDGATNWTTDGIVSPGTCVVTNGYCQFQTTKASYYAATQSTSSSSSSSNSNSSSIPNGPPNPYYCGDSEPAQKPNLFQIDITGNTAKLYFTPLNDTSDFYVSFSSVNKNAEEHGGSANLNSRDGVQSYSVYHLKPNTTYYFKVRGQKGCMPGGWSNILKVKTTANKSVTKKYYASALTTVTKSVGSIIQKIVPKSITKSKTVVPVTPKTQEPVDEIISPLANPDPIIYPDLSEPTIAPSVPITYPTQTPQLPSPTPTPKLKCFLWWCW